MIGSEDSATPKSAFDAGDHKVPFRNEYGVDWFVHVVDALYVIPEMRVLPCPFGWVGTVKLAPCASDLQPTKDDVAIKSFRVKFEMTIHFANAVKPAEE